MTRYRTGAVEAEGAERAILFSDGASLTVPTGRRSHYDGLVLERYDPQRGFLAIKLLDSVHFEDAGAIERISQEPGALIAEYENGLVAVFTLESTSRSATLQVQTSKPVSGTLRFDVRHVYDSVPYHKVYTISELTARDAKAYALDFEKRTEGDQRFDISQSLRFALYGSGVAAHRIDAWVAIEDEYDARRTGLDEHHYVYEPCWFEGCETIIITTKTRFTRLSSERSSLSVPDRRSAARIAARTQLRGSLLARGSGLHVLAGFPWFFQEWSRDAALSIGGLGSVLDEKERITILTRLARSLAEDEQSIQADEGSLRTADAMGLVMWRLSEENLDPKTKKRIARILETYLAAAEERMDGGLLTNGPLETWMDTGNGFRAGACVEIQALHARMLSFAHALTGDETYRQRLVSFVDTVRSRLIGSDGRIVDHIDTEGRASEFVAPNQFLAYVVYPGLFEPGTWHWSFDHALEVLTREENPGLLFSIEERSPLFCPHHTGADNRSYHRGDSWMFVNNLAALALARLDRGKYQQRIDAIIETSVRDCLEFGAFGGMSEISSAIAQDSSGCWAQTWSAATFVELMNELEK